MLLFKEKIIIVYTKQIREFPIKLPGSHAAVTWCIAQCKLHITQGYLSNITILDVGKTVTFCVDYDLKPLIDL